MIDTLIEWIAPHLCSSCGRSGTLFCDNCKSYIEMIHNGECCVCGAVCPTTLCASCRKIIDKSIIVGIRQTGLQRLIGGLKFKYMRAGARECAALLSPLLSPSDYDYIVPIPTSRRHRRIRGYDHMLLIAAALSRMTGIPASSLLLSTSDHTQHQLGRHERAVVIREAFAVVRPVSSASRYLIIDDIVTTGATLRQAAICLRQAGARHISVAAIARQPSTKPVQSVKMGKVPSATPWRGDRAV
jgi:ComF family protein